MPLTIAQKVALLVSIASGIEELHALGIIHGDIKPGNVLIGHRGETRLVGFGLAAQKAATSAATGFKVSRGRTIP